MHARRTGVTLIELLVTLTVLSIGVLALAPALVRLHHSAVDGQLELRAARLMAVTAERARVAPCIGGSTEEREPGITLRATRTVDSSRASTEIEVTTRRGAYRMESHRACDDR